MDQNLKIKAIDRLDRLPQGRSLTWRYEVVPAHQPLTLEVLRALFTGEIPGVVVDGVLSEEELRFILERIQETSEDERPYFGDLNISTVLDVPSHWEAEYLRQNFMGWSRYSQLMPTFDRARRRLTEGSVPDLLDIVAGRLGAGWPGRVSRAVHPVTGFEMYAGIIRGGAPKLHFDWAPFDLPGLPVLSQLGANIYLSNPGPGGDLKVYRVLGRDKGNNAESGATPVGNYELPHELVEGVEYEVIPAKPGALVIAPNRYLHEVTECPDETKRITFGTHAALLVSGDIVLFS